MDRSHHANLERWLDVRSVSLTFGFYHEPWLDVNHTNAIHRSWFELFDIYRNQTIFCVYFASCDVDDEKTRRIGLLFTMFHLSIVNYFFPRTIRKLAMHKYIKRHRNTNRRYWKERSHFFPDDKRASLNLFTKSMRLIRKTRVNRYIHMYMIVHVIRHGWYDDHR